jgi:hypothetical protein
MLGSLKDVEPEAYSLYIDLFNTTCNRHAMTDEEYHTLMRKSNNVLLSKLFIKMKEALTDADKDK